MSNSYFFTTSAYGKSMGLTYRFGISCEFSFGVIGKFAINLYFMRYYLLFTIGKRFNA